MDTDRSITPPPMFFLSTSFSYSGLTQLPYTVQFVPAIGLTSYRLLYNRYGLVLILCLNWNALSPFVLSIPVVLSGVTRGAGARGQGVLTAPWRNPYKNFLPPSEKNRCLSLKIYYDLFCFLVIAQFFINN